MLNISVAEKLSAKTNASKKSHHQPEYLSLDEIRRDGGTQPRAAINLQHVLLLEQQIEDGQELEAVIVFYDGESYWLADGYHRWHAHRNREEEFIACVIHIGSRRDAVLYSVGTNALHKPVLPRSREDKRRAVMTLLTDPEWKEWSNYQIANACRVNEKTVRNIRSSLTTEIRTEDSPTTLTTEIRSEDSPRTYKTKHGTVAKMKTANIGKKILGTQPDHNRVTVKDDHPLFAGQSGIITQSPNPDAAIVELDNGTRELIQLKDLDVEQLDVSAGISIAHHLKLGESVLVEIHAPNNSKINGRLARIAAVHQSTVEVWVRDVGTMTMHRHTLKHQQVEPVPMDREPQLVEVCLRINQLRKCNLDAFEIQILLLLEQPVVFTPVELRYLAHIEQHHGISFA